MHPARKTFAGAHTTPEKKPKVLCTHGLPLLHIAMCMVHLRAAAIVVFKGPVEHCRVRKNLCFQPPYKVEVFLLVDKGFLLCPLDTLAAAFDWVLFLAHQGNAFCKERFPWRMTFSTIKQAVLKAGRPCHNNLRRFREYWMGAVPKFSQSSL